MRPYDQEIDCGSIYDWDVPRPPREFPAVVGQGRGVLLKEAMMPAYQDDYWRRAWDGNVPGSRVSAIANASTLDEAWMVFGGVEWPHR